MLSGRRSASTWLCWASSLRFAFPLPPSPFTSFLLFLSAILTRSIHSGCRFLRDLFRRSPYLLRARSPRGGRGGCGIHVLLSSLSLLPHYSPPVVVFSTGRSGPYFRGIHTSYIIPMLLVLICSGSGDRQGGTLRNLARSINELNRHRGGLPRMFLSLPSHVTVYYPYLLCMFRHHQSSFMYASLANIVMHAIGSEKKEYCFIQKKKIERLLLLFKDVHIPTPDRLLPSRHASRGRRAPARRRRSEKLGGEVGCGSTGERDGRCSAGCTCCCSGRGRGRGRGTRAGEGGSRGCTRTRRRSDG